MTEDRHRKTDDAGQRVDDTGRKNRTIIYLPSVLCILFSGCTAYPGSPQACAGINDAAVVYNAKTGDLKAELCAGKENDSVKLSGKTPDGLDFLYEAQGAKAFAGQMTQAELNQALSRERGETIRELISAVKTLAPAIPVSPR